MAVVFTPSTRTRGSVVRRREPVCSGIPTRPDERFLGQPAAARRSPRGSVTTLPVFKDLATVTRTRFLPNEKSGFVLIFCLL